jgi:hypothetical protein
VKCPVIHRSTAGVAASTTENQKAMKNNYCYECGTKLVMRYPGGDPENGPATPRCPNDQHVPLSEVIDEAESALAEDHFGAVIEHVEKALETVTDDLWCCVVLGKGGTMEAVFGPMNEKEAIEFEVPEGTAVRVPLSATVEGANPVYVALRKLRKAIIEDLLEMPEDHYDAAAAAGLLANTGTDSDTETGIRKDLGVDDDDDYEEPNDGDPDSATENAAQQASVERDWKIDESEGNND